jgi:hypothetical protein
VRHPRVLQGIDRIIRITKTIEEVSGSLGAASL